jgi:hypothetical protein
VKSLASVARTPPETGSFLPPIFAALEAKGIRLREGTATFIAGVAGSMKTGLALYWVGRLNRPTLYFSADSEPFEMVERAAAMISGDTMTAVRANLPAYVEHLDQLNMRMVFEDSPSYKDLELEVAAYGEVYGKFPEVIVVDNLLNLVGENESEWAAHRDHARVIHRLTRITKATMVVLAHMGEDKTDPTASPPPRTKLQGKVSHLPKLILSLAFDGQRLKVAPVKNRFGPADASGHTYVELWCDPTRNIFYNSQSDFHAGRPA